MKIKAYFQGILLVLISGFCFRLSAQEELTITTYYPSPYGSYNQLYAASNIGIGTSNPGEELHIRNVSGDSVLLVDYNSIVKTAVKSNSSMGYIGTTTNNKLVLQTNGTERVTISEADNFVGIGVSNPTVALDVSGNIRVSLGGSTDTLACWKSGKTLGSTQCSVVCNKQQGNFLTDCTYSCNPCS